MMPLMVTMSIVMMATMAIMMAMMMFGFGRG